MTDRNNRPPTSDVPVRRAILPEICHAEDVALALGTSTPAARRLMRRGDCGPVARFGRRLVVRRDALLAAIAAREVDRAGPTPTLPHLRAGEGGRS